MSVDISTACAASSMMTMLKGIVSPMQSCPAPLSVVHATCAGRKAGLKVLADLTLALGVSVLYT